jgi:D-alanyl-D-alanine carboxypeptidase
MNPRRFATVAAVLCETALVACVAGFGSTGTETKSAVAIVDRLAPALAANVEFAEAPRATTTAIGNAAVDTVDIATVVKSVTVSYATPAADEPEPTVKVASTDPSQVLPPEIPQMQMAPANLPSPEPRDTKEAVSSIEIIDECLVVDVCIDRYLWALYERTPKEDTIKVDEQRKVTVKKKGKLRTVTKTFTKLVDENFAWKDPKAADKAGMSMMDYVIGGMDKSFKVKLFHALHAAQQAGFSPGITSAFRDDYRQSIASGLKAASDRSYHGGSFRGGYGHGLAADVVSVNGATRAQRQVSSENFWKWIDAHGKEFGIGRPYLDRDPPHVGPVDGKEYVDRRGPVAASDTKKGNRVADARR